MSKNLLDFLDTHASVKKGLCQCMTKPMSENVNTSLFTQPPHYLGDRAGRISLSFVFYEQRRILVFPCFEIPLEHQRSHIVKVDRPNLVALPGYSDLKILKIHIFPVDRNDFRLAASRAEKEVN
jgi:hypothetical protein